MDGVLSMLTFTFDRLENDSHRECLLYCCLFPEDHNIHIEELVDYWVGEGLLDDPRLTGNDDIDVARSRGLAVIKKLKDACLLEKGGGEDGDMYVKMHDVIRDMALWRSAEKKRFSLVPAGRGSSPNVPSDERWSDAVRISLMDGEVRDLSKFPHCPNLVTLLVNQNTQLNCIPSNFFNSVPILRVLDLSSTSIEELPAEIGMLIKLRYLNLSRTFITRLPERLGQLIMLEQLDLGYTRELVSIPSTAITTLIGLQKLNLCNSAYSWAPGSSEDDEETRVTLKHLSLLRRLNDLRLDVECLPILDEILGTRRLSRFVRHLTLQLMEPLTHLPTGFHALSQLRELCIDGCSSLQELTFSGGELECLEVLSLLDLSKITTIGIQGSALPSLRDLHVFSCHQLRDLTPVHQLPRLQCVDLRACSGLEVLISATVDENFPIFPQLRKINLYALPNFRAIYGHPLFLPCLEYLEVYGCPMFAKLPLDSHSAKSIKQILGMQRWWDSLQWDEESTKWRFLRYFRDLWQEEEEEEDGEPQLRLPSPRSSSPSFLSHLLLLLSRNPPTSWFLRGGWDGEARRQEQQEEEALWSQGQWRRRFPQARPSEGGAAAAAARRRRHHLRRHVPGAEGGGQPALPEAGLPGGRPHLREGRQAPPPGSRRRRPSPQLPRHLLHAHGSPRPPPRPRPLQPRPRRLPQVQQGPPEAGQVLRGPPQVGFRRQGCRRRPRLRAQQRHRVGDLRQGEEGDGERRDQAV
uniref:Disease resistance protein RPS2 n=2 Tax=Anthurium amnicola TaxID=1678845 RepID=A0A1D1YVZ1_9ARAE